MKSNHNNFHNLSITTTIPTNTLSFPQPTQPKEVYPLLCTAVPKVIPLPSRDPTQVRTIILRVVAPGTLTVIMESPKL
jgi:hypothetical protein